jgi:redox-sensing transcriptional repressor
MKRREETTPAIPEPTLARLHRYMTVLRRLRREGRRLVSSESLGQESGTPSALVRKDLTHLECYGQRGVGYETEALLDSLHQALGPEETRPLVIIGAGNLGVALSGYAGFDMQGYHIVGIFDADPTVVGIFHRGFVVRPMTDLPSVVKATGARIAVLAVPASHAQEAADQCVAAGLRGLLNFAPFRIQVPSAIEVRQVDLSEDLQLLNYQLKRSSSAVELGEK